MCVATYLYTYTYMQNIYIYIYMYVYSFIYSCVQLHTCAHAHRQICTHMYLFKLNVSGNLEMHYGVFLRTPVCCMYVNGFLLLLSMCVFMHTCAYACVWCPGLLNMEVKASHAFALYYG